METESLHLALITGLLGFGLLGSACSTFIREQTHGKQNTPLVSNLASIVIRGSSAAIVVFLAVEGGLGIFSGGTAEPNPYVLLFTCLVASVFSEDVWAWAKTKLKEQFEKKPSSQSQHQQMEKQEEKEKEKEKQQAKEPEQSPRPDESASSDSQKRSEGKVPNS